MCRWCCCFGSSKTAGVARRALGFVVSKWLNGLRRWGVQLFAAAQTEEGCLGGLFWHQGAWQFDVGASGFPLDVTI